MSFTRSKNYYVDTAAKMVFRDEDADLMEHIDTNLSQPWLTGSANTRGTAAPQE